MNRFQNNEINNQKKSNTKDYFNPSYESDDSSLPDVVIDFPKDQFENVNDNKFQENDVSISYGQLKDDSFRLETLFDKKTEGLKWFETIF